MNCRDPFPKKNPKLQKLLQDCIQLSHSQHKAGQGLGKVTACLSNLQLGSTTYSHSLSPGPRNTSVVILGKAGLRIYSQIFS